MGVDQDREHTEGAIVLDEAHAAHVRGQIERHLRIPEGDVAILFSAEVELQVLDGVEPLYHSSAGLMSTARIREYPCRRRSETRCPPMKPPAPHTTINSLASLCISCRLLLRNADLYRPTESLQSAGAQVRSLWY